MMRGERKCSLCEQEYKYCANCSDTAKSGETWRYMYCSENCREIFNVLSAKAFGHIGNEEAANKLQKLDLSKKSQFRDDYKKQVNDILASAKKEEPVVKEEPEKKAESTNKEEPVKMLKRKPKKIVNEERNDE